MDTQKSKKTPTQNEMWAPAGFTFDKKGNLIKKRFGVIESFDSEKPENNFAPNGYVFDQNGNLIKNIKKTTTMKKTQKSKAKKTAMTKNVSKAKPFTPSMKQIKGLAKGRRVQKKAMELMKESGQRTVTKKVYNMTLRDAMKKAAKMV